jgi:type I restriction-modification system DNA methylase subunit
VPKIITIFPYSSKLEFVYEEGHLRPGLSIAEGDLQPGLCFSSPFIVDLSDGIEPFHFTNRSSRIMTAPKEIIRLIERFEQNREQYTSGNYNEAQLRQEFLNPFFSALGWDVENRQGYAEPYKEVIHEDAVKVGGATKAPDYAFRIGGTRKFFVEAKNPSVNLKEDISPSYQLRRYAWSAKLPLSILTDFQEFAIYDCRTQPFKTDKASTGRVRYLTYKDYATDWDSIATVFSKEAVFEGSYDKFAESTKGKKGTAEVDDAFLKEIESWRDLLAKNIALRNPKLSQRELNFAVQRTIYRIIFLRICEDRGIEQYGRLLALVNGERVYRRLYEQFARADEKYNSGLFHFEPEKGRPEQPDELSPNLHIDDKPLKEIIGNLYYPDCPYEFSVLPADILGQVYEQFLGKVIRLTAGHQAKVEEKPEVKKAGGVYYTPTYIVDYIVKNTVGKLLNPETPEANPQKGDVILSPVGKESSSNDGTKDLNRPSSNEEKVSKPGPSKPLTPKEASKLRILDPACGSGSFLIGAYQYLLDWHRDWYVNDGPEKHARGKNATIFRGPGGEWRLTTTERKRILLNNIYGVDIDSQAVEVTKLSLLLKVLEGENEQTISQQLKMFHERALPDLGSNIKCGNSLIGPDFYDGEQLSLLDDEQKGRINVLDWEKEFRQIFDDHGFNAVVGNPPWGAEFSNDEKAYLRKVFEKIHMRTPESFNYFMGRMWENTQSKGLVGLILPSSFLYQHEFGKTRELLVKEAAISRVCNLGDGVFMHVTAPSCVLIFGSRSLVKRQFFQDLRLIERSDLPLHLHSEQFARETPDIGQDSEGYVLQPRTGLSIMKKCYALPPLKTIAEDVATGISSGLDVAYVYTETEGRRLHLEKSLQRKLIVGGEIDRYELNPRSGKSIMYLTPEVKIEEFPHCEAALLPYRERLKKRREAANGQIP